MQKYSKLILFWFVCLSAVVLSAYFIDNIIEIKSLALSTVSDVTTITTSLATLIVALLLYRRFNGSQSLVDEQTKKIMELIKYISEVRIYAEHIENGKVKSLVANVMVFNYRFRDKQESIFRNKKGRKFPQYVDQSMMDLLRYLGDFSFELYLPKNIADGIKKDFLYLTWFGERKADLKPSYLKVSARGGFETLEIANVGDDRDEYSGLLAKVNGDIRREIPNIRTS